MRHQKLGGKLGRTSPHRKAMLRNMVTSLLDSEQIETTDAKAKGVRRLTERMITLGKRGDLHARRRALRVIRSREVTAKVFDELAARYRERAGGYTRVLKVRQRVGDAAPLSIIELVDRGQEAPKSGDKKKSGRKKAESKAERKAEGEKGRAVGAKKTARKARSAKGA
jgi:large subunit ribosomal protein L17